MFRVTNELPPSEDGKRVAIEQDFKTFEEVVHKVIKDLEVVWNSPLITPYNLKVQKTDSTKEEIIFHINGDSIKKSKEEFKDLADRMFSDMCNFSAIKHTQSQAELQEWERKFSDFVR